MNICVHRDDGSTLYIRFPDDLEQLIAAAPFKREGIGDDIKNLTCTVHVVWCVFYCMDCKVMNPSIFMVHDELWAAHVEDIKTCLCAECFQTRLGRPLRKTDLITDVPCNIDFNFNWVDE